MHNVEMQPIANLLQPSDVAVARNVFVVSVGRHTAEPIEIVFIGCRHEFLIKYQYQYQY